MPTVRDIHFYEQKRFLRVLRGTDDNALRTAMYQDEASLTGQLPVVRNFAERPVLDMDTLRQDAWRVELWYADHGYFNAELTSWEVRTRRQPRRYVPAPMRAPVVNVIGYVNEGEPSLVRSVEVEGVELAGRAFRIKLDRSIGDMEGSTFNMATARSLESLVVSLLKDQSYARAKAELQVTAYPEELAVDIRVIADPGEPCVFGEVTIEGAEEVPESLIREFITVKPGRAYSPSALSNTQSALFNLGTFSVVQLIPDLTQEGTVIPVTVKVQETRFRRLRVGGGVAKQPSEAQVRARTEFSHTNIGGRLVNLETSLTGGYKAFSQGGATLSLNDLVTAVQQSSGSAVLSDASNNLGSGPFLDFEAELGWPRFLDVPKLRLHPMVGAELGTDIGQTYRFVEVSPAFTWQSSQYFSLTPSYHFEFWDTDLAFVDPTNVDVSTRSEFERYSLHYLKLQLVYDRRDDKIYTRSGYYGELSLTDAGAPIFPGLTFAKVEVDMRRYFRVVRPARSVVAMRLAGGVAQPYILGDRDPDQAHVPYNDRFFLGGLYDVRGFTRGYLGPRTCALSTDTTDANGDTTTQVTILDSCDVSKSDPTASDIDIYPTGALAAAWGSVEYRIEGPFAFTYAAFMDVGMAAATIEDLIADPLGSLQPVVGGGVRYRTPMGPLRVDVGVRLRAPSGEYSLDRRWGLHLALQEAF
ncbi:MAG: BamA/TamA family outer membrane protein [Alphaproteobacteria bacterium]|nr:BamA/TamA family outer membrane protein [Alphaproteobacteria bacterium]